MPYPDDAWLDARGKPFPGKDDQRRLSDDARRDLAAREGRRLRYLDAIHIPPAALRKGVNIVALEFRRSDSHPVGYKGWPWPIGMDAKSLRLSAAGTGVIPNVSRPKGLRIWNYDPSDRLLVRDWADPNEDMHPIRIVAARNGSFGGMVVLSSTDPLTGLAAKSSDLTSTGGATAIPSTSIALFSAVPDGHAYQRIDWFDGLQSGIPAESPLLQIKKWQQKPIDDAAVLPVYVRIRVPKDAAAGEYRGQLSLSANGQSFVVPIQLHVAAWAIPDPPDYRTYVGIYQSPTTLAMQYKVAEWSEAHWKLMDRSFAHLARAGNKIVNVTVVDQTQFGNDDGMIYWIRKPDGSWDYDFSVFDRYMALAKKHFVHLDYVVLHIWHSGGWDTRKADQTNTVTVLDPKTGQRSHMQVPSFDSDQSKALWKPLLAQVHQRLAKLGLEKAMCIGTLSDGTAPNEVFKAFDDIWPGGGPARWTRGLHTQMGEGGPYRASKGGGLVVLHEHCYGTPIATPAQPLPPLWKYRGDPATCYPRFSDFIHVTTLQGYRLLPSYALFLKKQGVGRICFDYWPILQAKGGDEDAHVLYNRYPHSSCAQRAPALFRLSWPGPDGAETTLRYEALCEGVQESEAMIFISEALDKHAAALGDDLAARCRKVLYDRLWFVLTRKYAAPWGQMYNRVNHYGWQDLNSRLFDTAGEVSHKLSQ